MYNIHTCIHAILHSPHGYTLSALPSHTMPNKLGTLNNSVEDTIILPCSSVAGVTGVTSRTDKSSS